MIQFCAHGQKPFDCMVLGCENHFTEREKVDQRHAAEVIDDRWYAEPAPVRRRVVSGVICNGPDILLARRDGRSDYVDHWECSGGKVEEGETDEQALRRECEEELGVEVQVGAEVGRVELDPPLVRKPVLVVFYACTILNGILQARTSAEVGWFTAAQMRTLALMPANAALLPQVLAHMRAHADRRFLREGWCVVFASGPPWNWIPRVQRSNQGLGISLTWLWWGLHFVPIPVAALLTGGIRVKKAAVDAERTAWMLT